ncbi:MAG: HEAT repeat domain-containing protein [Deltaproteobacteria bacterium]|nr:HEAT repeat domain-containing protein [Deltaproteobacteria bacterium]
MAYEVTTQTSTSLDMAPLMSEVEIEGQQLAAQATAMEQQASRSWRIDLEVIARTNEGATILAAHIDAEPTQMVGRTQVPPTAELSDTFLVRLDSRCNILDFGWRTDGNRASAADQQQLLAGLNYLAPPAGRDGYGGMTFDPVGRYYAAFNVGKDGSLEGRAVDYREPFGRSRNAMMPSFDVTASTIAVRPQPGEWFASLHNHRELSIAMAGHSIGEVSGTVSARRVDPGPWRPAVEPDDGGWTWGILMGQQVSPGAESKANSSSALAGVSIDDALHRYRAIIAEKGSSIDAVPLLVEWLQANPDGATELLTQLRSGTFEGQQRASAGLFLALGTAGTQQATDALLEIIGGPGDDPGHKVSAAFALSNVEEPTTLMIDTVVAAAHSDVDRVTRGSLAMGLGAFASRNAERSPELAAQAREQIGSWLADPADDEQLAASLMAAGNAGHDDLAPTLDPYFDHEDPQIRRRATHALRHMSPEEAYPRLSERMLDVDEVVRASAVETALEVSRARGAAPPVDMVDMAIENLDMATPKREHKALLGLLGEAAKHGSPGAGAVLQQHFADELERGAPDIDKLQALGQHTNNRWTAD